VICAATRRGPATAWRPELGNTNLKTEPCKLPAI
jgi:hypothetical protein